MSLAKSPTSFGTPAAPPFEASLNNCQSSPKLLSAAATTPMPCAMAATLARTPSTARGTTAKAATPPEVAVKNAPPPMSQVFRQRLQRFRMLREAWRLHRQLCRLSVWQDSFRRYRGCFQRRCRRFQAQPSNIRKNPGRCSVDFLGYTKLRYCCMLSQHPVLEARCFIRLYSPCLSSRKDSSLFCKTDMISNPKKESFSLITKCKSGSITVSTSVIQPCSITI